MILNSYKKGFLKIKLEKEKEIRNGKEPAPDFQPSSRPSPLSPPGVFPSFSHAAQTYPAPTNWWTQVPRERRPRATHPHDPVDAGVNSITATIDAGLIAGVSSRDSPAIRPYP